MTYKRGIEYNTFILQLDVQASLGAQHLLIWLVTLSMQPILGIQEGRFQKMGIPA